MNDLSEFCGTGVKFSEDLIPVTDHVSLRVVTFTPAIKNDNPAVVFVAGWVSMMTAWQEVLVEMTRDFPVYYIETREKISSRVTGKEKFDIETMGLDIVAVISHLNLKSRNFILFGSSLGATVILDCCRFLQIAPLCLVLVGPNAVFRAPKPGQVIVWIFHPRFYLMIKPVIKWYLRNFRLDVASDYGQYTKYCNALDAADPWKLKKAAISLWHYQVWEKLAQIPYPTLIIGASKDVLHEPENLKQMTSMMQHATYLDLETNKLTHSKGMVMQIREYLKSLAVP